MLDEYQRTVHAPLGFEMDRTGITIAALAAAGENASFTPVQVQKLFFLLDREATHLTGGPHFHFVPYDYGPFDRSVYDALEEGAAAGDVQINWNGRYNVYSLTEVGFRKGQTKLVSLSPEAISYLTQVVAWIKKLSFQQLVAAIYRRYPEMKENSIFTS